MMRYLSKPRLLHYLFLGVILLVGAVVFSRFQYFPNYQFLVVIGTVMAYILWGVSYHSSETRLNFRTISEYILLGLVVVLMFAAALNVRV